MRFLSLSIFITVFFGILLSSCHDPYDAPLPDVSLNAEYEMHPPIADSISIEILKNNKHGNVLLTADFGTNQLTGLYHAMQLSSGKIVLRDDGKGGDKIEKDGKFTVLLKEDLETLESWVKAAQSNDAIHKDDQRLYFIGRHAYTKDMLPDSATHRNGRRPMPPPIMISNLHDFENYFIEQEVRISACNQVTNVSAAHSIFIKDLGVVEDYTRIINPCTNQGVVNGPWTFERLMNNIANEVSSGINTEEMVKNWLENWLDNVAINGDRSLARTALLDVAIIPWAEKSGSRVGSVNPGNWKTQKLNLAKAPFKLLAIVNRTDLRGNNAYGNSNNGQLNFIFEMVGPYRCSEWNDEISGVYGGVFNVMFEFGVPSLTCIELKQYATDFYNLKNMQLGSVEYNAALQNLTDLVTAPNAAPGRVNGSSLNCIRTNGELGNANYELREFRLDAATHLLKQVTVKQEPAGKFNPGNSTAGNADQIKLGDWMLANADLILDDAHTVPEALPTGEPLLAASSLFQGGVWNAFSSSGKMREDIRHHFALSTCKGCHGDETIDVIAHVSSSPFGRETALSTFLSGGGNLFGAPYQYNDLERRKQNLQEYLCNECSLALLEIVHFLNYQPITFVH